MKNKEIEELLNYIDQFVYVDQTYNDIKLSKIDCKLLLSYIEQLENNRDKAIDYLEKSKLNQLDTHCKYLHIDFDAEKIENIDELIDILKGDSDNE